MNDYIQYEANTVFSGTLLEDMIITVTRTKKLYCNVYIPDLFVQGYSHPLTYVPFYMMSLPLKKGDTVLVRFKDDDYSLPYLWKNPKEIDSGFYELFNLGTGNLPTPETTVSAMQFGENSFLIKTDSYTLIHQNDAYVLLNKNNEVYLVGNKVHVVANKFSIQTPNGISVYTILSNILQILNSSLSTSGSPANHVVVPGQFTQIISNLNSIME